MLVELLRVRLRQQLLTPQLTPDWFASLVVLPIHLPSLSSTPLLTSLLNTDGPISPGNAFLLPGAAVVGALTAGSAFTPFGPTLSGYNFGAGDGVPTAFQPYTTYTHLFLQDILQLTLDRRIEFTHAINSAAGNLLQHFTFSIGRLDAMMNFSHLLLAVGRSTLERPTWTPLLFSEDLEQNPPLDLCLSPEHRGTDFRYGEEFVQ